MPYLQPRTANYFGFQPATGIAPPQSNVYLVSSSEAGQISIGDVVVYATDKQTVRVTSGPTDAALMVGVAASLVVANGGSTAADPRILSTQTVSVWDHPEQIFVGCDTTSGVFGVGTHIGKAFQVLATGAIGSTGPNGTFNRSVMAISGVTASSGSAISYRFTVVGLHPCENAFSTVAVATAAAATEVRKLLLKPVFHSQRQGHSGTGHVTT